MSQTDKRQRSLPLCRCIQQAQHPGKSLEDCSRSCGPVGIEKRTISNATVVENHQTYNMLPSDEISWLDVGVGEGTTFTLLDHGRLECVIAELVEPRSQYPALCAFLGAKWKDTSLRQLYPHNNIKRRDSKAAVRLHYDIGSWGTS